MATKEDLEFGRAAVALGFVDSPLLAKCLKNLSGVSGRQSLAQFMVKQQFLSESQVSIIRKQQFGRYRIVKEIGRGGMGRVYKSYDTELNRELALKILIAGDYADEKEVERFIREAKATAKLDHPNIVTVYDIGQEQGQYFFTMDYLEKGSLQDLLHKTTLSPRRIVEIMILVGDAIHYAHNNGIIHRDLKPANIMLDSNNNPIVMDFGLVKLANESKRLSKSGMVIGTLQYMPPEQAEGKRRDIDNRSDVYALGAMFYEMLTGEAPFSGSSFSNIVEQVVSRDPVRPTALRNTVPKGLENICLKAMAKKKEDRYQSAASMVDDLVRFSQGESVEARAPGMRRLLMQKIKRHKKAFICGGLVVVSVLALLVGILVQKYLGQIESQNREQKAQIDRQQKIDKALLDVDRILKTALKEKDLIAKYPKNQFSTEISILEREERKEVLKEYRQARMQLERILVLTPKSKKIKNYLYQIDSQIGLLALGARNYLLSEISFERCKNLGIRNEETRQLLDQVVEYQENLRNRQLQAIDNIMARLRNNKLIVGVLNQYIIEMVRMQGKHISFKLLRYMNSKYAPQRYIAVDALGKLGHIEVKDQDVVALLLKRMENLDTDDTEEEKEAIHIIWALGRLKDPRANEPVYDIRWTTGQNSPFWYNTYVPFGWIPMNEVPVGKVLTAKQWDKRGIMSHQKGDMDGALRCYSKALRIDPKSADALTHVGIAYLVSGKTEAAMAQFNKALAIDPKHAKSYTNRGLGWLRAGNYKKALTNFNKAIELEPDSSTYGNRGTTYLAFRNYKKAILDLNRAIELNKKNAKAYNSRAGVFLQSKKYKLALKDLEVASRLDPRNSQVYMNRAYALENLGDIDGALRDLNKAVLLDPYNMDIYANRAITRREKRDFEGAIADYTEAIYIFKNPRMKISSFESFSLTVLKLEKLYCRRGIVHYEARFIQKAIADFSEAIRVNPRYAEPYYRRGVIYSNSKGQQYVRRMLNDFQAFLALEPRNSPRAKRIRDFLRRFR